MKRIGILFIIFFAINLLNAQTNVLKMSATKSTDYGVTYYLPRTVLKVQVNYSKTIQKAGPYSKFAEKYLGVTEQSVVFEDNISYTLDNISVDSKGVVDKNASYLVEFKAKTTSPFVYLTEDGLICTINADYVQDVVNNRRKANVVPSTELSSPRSQPVFTEEYLTAGSVTKKAEVAAKQIYKLREYRNDLLTGEAENAPLDGEGIKIVLSNIEAQEKFWVELFTGTTSVESFEAEYEIEPLSDIDKEVLFRFSKYIGIVDADDLSGSPVYINVKNLNFSIELEMIDPKRKAKEPQSIVYNNPGKAEVEVFFGISSMYKNVFQIVQFGNKQILAPSLFDDKKAPVKIYFYPETGAIKQIIQ